MRRKFRRWVNVKLVGIAERIMRRIAEDGIHWGSTRTMARDVVCNIRDIRQIINNK